jgi:hypothetical protein
MLADHLVAIIEKIKNETLSSYCLPRARAAHEQSDSGQVHSPANARPRQKIEYIYYWGTILVFFPRRLEARHVHC